MIDEQRLIPGRQEVGERAAHEHDVHRSVADHLVRDRDVAGARVVDLRDAHAGSLTSRLTRWPRRSIERKLLVGGEWVETGEWIDVRSPYSGDVVGRVPKAGAAEARQAIDAAERAMSEPLPAHKRAEILVRVAGYLGKRHDEVAQTICAEAGKPMKAARVEAARAMSTYTFAAVEARKLAGDMVPMDASQAGVGKLAFTLRRPIGVVGAISPFNFPLNLVAHKIAPGAGRGLRGRAQARVARRRSPRCCSPSSSTRPGLPPGWLNVLTGPAAEIGDVLVEDERVKLITFTGSSDVGWKLRERAARKKVALELGNATPVIVEADADLDEAASKLAANAFSFAGQSCISVQRIYVQRAAYDGFLERFLPGVEALQAGDPSDEDTDVGPVIDDDARERILAWIEEARSLGADVLTGGEADGPVISPTVIADAPPQAKVSCEEVFGPVVTVSAYDTLRRSGGARERHPLRPAGRNLHGRRTPGAGCGPASSSSAESP